MKKRVISFILCGMMLMPMNVMASELPAVESESISIIEETETATEVVETEAVIETVETELITEAVISEVETELITEGVETELITEIETVETELVTETNSTLLTVKEVETKNATEAQVGDTFKTYFGEFQILTVGENPTVAVIGGMRTDYDDNFWYGDTSKPWTAKYLDVEYAVTRISARMAGSYINIPEGVEYIDNQVFKFDSVASLTLPSTLVHFDEDHALGYLESITVAEGNPYYKSVDNVLFTADGKDLLLYPAMDSRESYSTPEGTSKLAYSAFFQNSNLKILSLDHIQVIDQCAFQQMKSIETINFSKFLTAFDPNYNLYMCNTLQNIYVDDANPYYFDDNGVFYFKNANRYNLVCYPASHTLPSYTIPYGVNAISEFAFCQTGITNEIIIPSTIVNVYTKSFMETLVPMDIVLQLTRTNRLSQGSFENICEGSRVIVPSEETKDAIRKDAFLINRVLDERIPIVVDYERAVSKVNNWYETNGKTYYYNENGEVVKGYVEVAGRMYYFDTEGVRQSGFITVDGKIFYFSPENKGALSPNRGVVSINNKRYFFNTDYSLFTQKEITSYGVTYYFNTSTHEIICDSTSHTFSSWVVGTESTCLVEGTSSRSCVKCKSVETKSTPKTAHRFGNWSVTRPSDCVIVGEETRACSVCSSSETKSIPTVDHKFSNWEVVEIATCTNVGKSRKSCNVCSYGETKEIAMTAHVGGNWVISKPASCKYTGSRYIACKFCKFRMKTETIKATGHSYGAWKTVTPAKVGVKGTKTQTCSKCGTRITTSIPALKATSISKASVGKLSSLTYNGKYRNVYPTVKVGSTKLVRNRDYTLSYKNNKYAGKVTVKITGKGNYSGYKNVSYYILPKAPTSVKVKSSKKGNMAVSYKASTRASGYMVSYSTSSKFRSVKTTKTSSVSKSISKLSSKKTYYVKVRSYVTVSGKNYYSAYSSVAKIRVK